MSLGTESTGDPFIEQIAAYALGILDPDEAAEIKAHLAACASCRSELGAYQAAATALAWDIEEIPEPPGHRDRFRTKAGFAPTVAEPNGHRDRFRDKLAASTTEGSPAQPAPRRGVVERAPSRPWWQALNPFGGWAVAGALAMLLLLAGAWGLQLQERVATADRQAAQVAQQAAAADAQARSLLAQRDVILAAIGSPGSRSITLAGQGALKDAQAQVWIDPATHHAVLATQNLPPPPAGKVYELWMIRGGTPVAIDILPTGAQATLLTFDVPPGPATEYNMAALTVEDRKVDQPTSKPVMVGQL